MFVNSDAASIVLKFLVAGSLLLCLALVTHVVWIDCLARSDTLSRLGPAARIALLALAAATPVVSFYGIGAGLGVRRLARRHGPAGAAGIILGIVVALAAVVLGLLDLSQLRRPVPGPQGSDVLALLPGMLVVAAVPCAMLGMACQVLVRSAPARAVWIVVAGAAATGLFLFV